MMAPMHHLGPQDLIVSLTGNDDWSGRLPEADAAGQDGPLRTVTQALWLLLSLIHI
jgi:hypothetical protein